MVLPVGSSGTFKSGRKWKIVSKGRNRRTRRRAPNTFAKKVLAIVNRQEETKYQRETIEANVKHNSQISNNNDWYRCLPKVIVGTNAAQRIGDVIKPVSCKLHVQCRFNTDEKLTRDIYVVFYLVTSKRQKAYLNENANGQMNSEADSFLRDKDDTVTFYDGTWSGTTLPIELDSFTLLKKKVIHMFRASGAANGAGVDGTLTGTGMYSNEGKNQINFTVPIKVPTLKYSPGFPKLPNNFAAFYGIGYYYADGTAADTGVNGLLYVTTHTELWYKDV